MLSMGIVCTVIFSSYSVYSYEYLFRFIPVPLLIDVRLRVHVESSLYPELVKISYRHGFPLMAAGGSASE